MRVGLFTTEQNQRGIIDVLVLIIFRPYGALRAFWENSVLIIWRPYVALCTFWVILGLIICRPYRALV